METQMNPKPKYTLEYFTTHMLRSLARKCMISNADAMSREELIESLHEMLLKN